MGDRFRTAATRMHRVNQQVMGEPVTINGRRFENAIVNGFMAADRRPVGGGHGTEMSGTVVVPFAEYQSCGGHGGAEVILHQKDDLVAEIDGGGIRKGDAIELVVVSRGAMQASGLGGL